MDDQVQRVVVGEAQVVAVADPVALVRRSRRPGVEAPETAHRRHGVGCETKARTAVAAQRTAMAVMLADDGQQFLPRGGPEAGIGAARLGQRGAGLVVHRHGHRVPADPAAFGDRRRRRPDRRQAVREPQLQRLGQLRRPVGGRRRPVQVAAKLVEQRPHGALETDRRAIQHRVQAMEEHGRAQLDHLPKARHGRGLQAGDMVGVMICVMIGAPAHRTQALALGDRHRLGAVERRMGVDAADRPAGVAGGPAGQLRVRGLAAPARPDHGDIDAPVAVRAGPEARERLAGGVDQGEVEMTAMGVGQVQHHGPVGQVDPGAGDDDAGIVLQQPGRQVRSVRRQQVELLYRHGMGAPHGIDQEQGKAEREDIGRDRPGRVLAFLLEDLFGHRGPPNTSSVSDRGGAVSGRTRSARGLTT
jgi:hypothetical protein